MPPILNIQMDNCAKDTNVDMCFVCSRKWWLRAFFKEVYVSFLMVGHAHNGIDAVFWMLKHEVAWRRLFNNSITRGILHWFGRCSGDSPFGWKDSWLQGFYKTLYCWWKWPSCGTHRTSTIQLYMCDNGLLAMQYKLNLFAPHPIGAHMKVSWFGRQWKQQGDVAKWWAKT